MKNIMLAIAILTLVFVIGCSQNITGNLVQDEKIEIGFIAPLSGEYAIYGKPLMKSIEFAFNEINENGGINGEKLELLTEDGKCNVAGGATAAQKLVNIDQVKIIIGGFCSGETLGAGPIVEENKVILFSAASTSPDITKAGDYIFRNVPSDALAGREIAKTAMKKGDKKIAILTENTDFAFTITREFKESFNELNGNVVYEDNFLTNNNDFRTILLKLEDEKPDAIYIVTTSPSALINLLKQMQELGIKLQIYSTTMLASSDLVSENANILEGAIFATEKFDQNSILASNLFSELKSNYPEIDKNIPQIYLATIYDASYIIRDSLLTCGEDTECIKNYLYSIENRMGAAGSLTIDENGDAKKEYSIMQINNGIATEIN